jgi:3-phosphoshikimate 1-carboxyvinyltransferase
MTPPPLVLTAPEVRHAAHVAMVCAARTKVPCRLVLHGLDMHTRSTLFAISSMGAEIFRDGSDLLFAPVPKLRPALGPLHCGPSPTTLCFVLAHASAMSRKVEVRASSSVSLESVAPMLAPLRSLGARVEAGEGPKGTLVLRVHGPISAGPVRLEEPCTADHILALLSALFAVEGTSTLTVPRGRRHAWQARILHDFGLRYPVETTPADEVYTVSGIQHPTRSVYSLPGDWTLAVPLLVAAALQGRPLELHGLRRLPTSSIITQHLLDFGLATTWQQDALVLQPGPIRSAGTLDLRSSPELVAPLAILAAFAPAPTTFVAFPTPALDLLCRALRRVGAAAKLSTHGLTVGPGAGLHGRVGLRSGGHPGLTRALRLLGLRLPAVMVEAGPEADPPGYNDLMARLQGLPAADVTAAR